MRAIFRNDLAHIGMSALWYFHHSQGSNCCATPSAAAKYVGNSDWKADSELRSLLVGLSSDTLDGEKYLAVLNSSTSQVIVKLFLK